MPGSGSIPPPPPGYTVVDDAPPPPAGYTIVPDSQAPATAPTYPGNTPSAPNYSLGGFAGNIVKSTGRLVGNVASTIAHPFNTVEAVGDVIGGAIQDATGGKLIPQDITGSPNQVAAFHNFIDQFKQRYGSLEGAKRTLYEDPVGAAADLSTLLDGVGLAGRGVELAADAAKAGDVARGARAVSEAAKTGAAYTNPVTLATKPAAVVVDRAGAPVAARLYHGALKPIKTNSIEGGEQMVQTGIENRLNPGVRADYDKLNALISNYRDQINKGIDARPNATIDPADVATRVDDMRPRFQTVNPDSDLRDIDRSKQEFLSQFTPAKQQPSGLLGPNGQPLATPPQPGPRPITLREAQDLKTKTNATLAGQYGSQSEAAIEARKALVLGLKEETEKIFPELSQLNEKQAQLLNLQPSFEAAIKRVASRDLVPGGTGDVTGAVTKKLFDDPKWKARLAFALENTREFGRSSGMSVAGRAALVDSRIQSYLGSLTPAQ